MDALIAPVNEAILVVEQLAQGLLDIKMIGNYQGDNAKLKDALNSTMATLSDVIGEYLNRWDKYPMAILPSILKKNILEILAISLLPSNTL
jgi:hypothetical protein